MDSTATPTAKTNGSPAERTLSTTVRNMRFMARSSESALRERLVEEQKRTESEAQWRLLDSQTLQGILRQGKGQRIVTSDSANPSPSVTIMTGRKSFGNFNASIEISTKELETAAKNAALEANEAKERISEKEMTERFGTLVQGGAQKKSPKKSKKKRQTDEMSEESPSRTPKKKKKSNATLSQEFEIGPSSRFSGISEEGTDKVFMRPTE